MDFTGFAINGSDLGQHIVFTVMSQYPLVCESFSSLIHLFFFLNDVDSFEEYQCGILENVLQYVLVWCFSHGTRLKLWIFGKNTTEVQHAYGSLVYNREKLETPAEK